MTLALYTLCDYSQLRGQPGLVTVLADPAFDPSFQYNTLATANATALEFVNIPPSGSWPSSSFRATVTMKYNKGDGMQKFGDRSNRGVERMCRQIDCSTYECILGYCETS